MASGGIKANQAGKVLEQQVVSLPPLGQDTVNESQDAACLRMHKAFYHPQVPDNASLRALSAEYESLKISWRKTSGYEYSKHVLVDVILRQEKLKLSSAMCLALGSLTDYEEGMLTKPGFENRPLAQLIAFEDWIELLRTKHAIDVIYFQDPAFNAIDITFLESKGYVVLQSPESETHLNEQTFLYTPYAVWGVTLASINRVKPRALYIGHDLTKNRLVEEKLSGPNGEDVPPEQWLKIPIANPLQRRVIRAFMAQRAAIPRPAKDRNPRDWLGFCVYYKADSEDNSVPVKFATKDEELYTDQEAKEFWKAHGYDITNHPAGFDY